MPTPTGAETIGERLARLRADLARVRVTLARQENNGGQWTMGGTAVTEITYERARARSTQLEEQITALEARLSGSRARPGVAQTATVFD